jgi:hypothetical protein
MEQPEPGEGVVERRLLQMPLRGDPSGDRCRKANGDHRNEESEPLHHAFSL